jgi:ABC-type Zn2+ transport system substrate-binding protein/surface adhesin
MITLDDIEDMTDLTRDEIAAVAEHEHMPEIAAALAGNYALHLHHGPQRVQKMICDDIRDALHRDDPEHARKLFATLRHFMAEHPEAARGAE